MINFITSLWAKHKKFTVIAVLVLFGLVSLASYKPEATPTQNVKAETKTPTAIATQPVTLEDKVKSTIPPIAKSSTVKIGQGYDLQTTEDVPNTKVVEIKMDFGSDQWDANSAKSNGRDVAADLFQKVFPMDSDIQNIVVKVTLPTTDDYGNDQHTQILAIGLNRSTYQKIKWDKFKSDNFSSIADLYLENKALK